MNFDSHAKSMLILLVDNNETTSQQLIKYLKNYDHTITVTTNVKNAINLIISENNFDVILLNSFTLPSDAFQTIETFEKSGQISKQNIIQLTSLSFNEQVVNGIGNMINEVNR